MSLIRDPSKSKFNDFIIKNTKQKKLYGKENFIISLINNFETQCILLESKGVNSPRKLTKYEFIKRIEFYGKSSKNK